MARASRPPGLTDYEWRVVRQTGLLPSQMRARGLSLQAARGHRLKTAAPGRGEKAQTAARQRAKGLLTETDRRFLDRQLAKTSDYYEKRTVRRGNTLRTEFVVVETAADRWRRARDAYTKATPEERDAIRHMQQALGRARRAAERSGRKFIRSDPGQYLSDEDYAVWEDQFGDDWPDLDDDYATLFFYH